MEETVKKRSQLARVYSPLWRQRREDWAASVLMVGREVKMEIAVKACG
jgi:hypothetical protein